MPAEEDWFPVPAEIGSLCRLRRIGSLCRADRLSLSGLLLPSKKKKKKKQRMKK